MIILLASIAVGILVAWLLFGTFFGDFAGFLECARYWFTPDIISLFRGEWSEDWWASAKLSLYMALCAGSGISAYFALHKIFG